MCEDCLGKTFAWPGVVHKCYRGSRAITAVTAAMLTTHKLMGTWGKSVDAYIALTDFVRQKLVEGDSHRIRSSSREISYLRTLNLGRRRGICNFRWQAITGKGHRHCSFCVETCRKCSAFADRRGWSGGRDGSKSRE